MVATVPEGGESVASEEHLNTPFSVLDLVPASLEFATQQVKSGFALISSAAQTDCSAELVATTGPLLAAASSAPARQQEFSNVSSEEPPALMCRQAPATMNCGLSLDSMDQMLLTSGRRGSHQLYAPWKASWISLATRLGPAISTVMRVPAGILRTTRETTAAARTVLRHWILGFTHDCKVTVNAMGFLQIKKTLPSARVLATTRETMAAARGVLRHWMLGFTHDLKVTLSAMGFPQMKKSLGQWLHQPMSRLNR
jgi:hypothetical protein